MNMKETNKDIKSLLEKIDRVHISNTFFAMMNDQSCDCEEIIIKSNDNYVRIRSEAIGEDGHIVFDQCLSIKENDYPYEVCLEGSIFRFDKFSHLENGMIEGIRFVADGVFLFIFALKNNLVVTMSKYDLFEEIEMDFPEQEAEIVIRKRSD